MSHFNVVFLLNLQSLYQGQLPPHVPGVRDAQRLSDVWLVIVESLLQDLPFQRPVSWLPPPVTDHDSDSSRRGQKVSCPWGKRSLQHHGRFTSNLPQVVSQQWRLSSLSELTILEKTKSFVRVWSPDADVYAPNVKVWNQIMIFNFASLSFFTWTIMREQPRGCKYSWFHHWITLCIFFSIPSIILRHLQ